MAIRSGEEVTITYTRLLSSTPERRSRLLRQWFFLCGCRRCLSEDELGTWAGSPTCPWCRETNLLPQAVTEEEIEQENCVWRCSK